MSVAPAGEHVSLRVEDGRRRLEAVRLVTELTKRLPPRSFVRRPGSRVWELRFPRPDVDRMEYQLELTYRDGGTEQVPDPANPLRAPGPFGERSVLEFPGYRPPMWLVDTEAPAGTVEPLALPSRRLGSVVRGRLWSSVEARPGAELPLLLVHDGPEYADYAALVRFLDAAAAEKELPPMRAALLAPVHRDQHYSAAPTYAAALVHEVLPALDEVAPAGRSPRIGMGASLGALALLHAHRVHPEPLDALFLQSGSFFQSRLDGQESRFVRFDRIAAFIDRVVRAEAWRRPIPLTLTCGTAEENLANNRALGAALDTQGYAVALHEHRDAHNWVSWRDSLDPPLVELIAKACA